MKMRVLHDSHIQDLYMKHLERQVDCEVYLGGGEEEEEEGGEYAQEQQ